VDPSVERLGPSLDKSLFVRDGAAFHQPAVAGCRMVHRDDYQKWNENGIRFRKAHCVNSLNDGG
jgi:hypothetical protein